MLPLPPSFPHHLGLKSSAQPPNKSVDITDTHDCCPRRAPQVCAAPSVLAFNVKGHQVRGSMESSPTWLSPKFNKAKRTQKRESYKDKVENTKQRKDKEKYPSKLNINSKATGCPRRGVSQPSGPFPSPSPAPSPTMFRSSFWQLSLPQDRGPLG